MICKHNSVHSVTLPGCISLSVLLHRGNPTDAQKAVLTVAKFIRNIVWRPLNDMK